jgi:hypothetical protein
LVPNRLYLGKTLKSAEMTGYRCRRGAIERKNFDFAGQALAEIWSGVIIDNFPVVAEYITPENSELPGD